MSPDHVLQQVFMDLFPAFGIDSIPAGKWTTGSVSSTGHCMTGTQLALNELFGLREYDPLGRGRRITGMGIDPFLEVGIYQQFSKFVL